MLYKLFIRNSKKVLLVVVADSSAVLKFLMKLFEQQVRVKDTNKNMNNYNIHMLCVDATCLLLETFKAVATFKVFFTGPASL